MNERQCFSQVSNGLFFLGRAFFYELFVSMRITSKQDRTHYFVGGERSAVKTSCQRFMTQKVIFLMNRQDSKELKTKNDPNAGLAGNHIFRPYNQMPGFQIKVLKVDEKCIGKPFFKNRRLLCFALSIIFISRILAFSSFQLF